MFPIARKIKIRLPRPIVQYTFTAPLMPKSELPDIFQLVLHMWLVSVFCCVDKRFPCHLCTNSYERRHALNEHIRSKHTRGTVYTFVQCCTFSCISSRTCVTNRRGAANALIKRRDGRLLKVQDSFEGLHCNLWRSAAVRASSCITW